jgi:2-C-methyl-D-erythritol 4-phosphate cytidylyltransferase
MKTGVEKPYKKAAALIVAAGEGSRMGSVQGKVFLPLDGIPILVRAIRPFEACEQIESIHVVLREQDFPAWLQEVSRKFSFKKVRTPVAGGLRRQDSVRLGLESIREDFDIILIHDGARPLLDVSMLARVLSTMEGVQAAVMAVPAKDTLKSISPQGQVMETLTRDTLWHTQTPQAFDYHLIVEAHRRALEEGFLATDDSMLVERLGVPVVVVRGSYDNIKITTPEDLAIARAILESRR